MKISEAILQLNEALNLVGDVDIIKIADVDGCFMIDNDIYFDVIEIPGDDENDDELIPVCALFTMNNEGVDENGDSAPGLEFDTKNENKKPKLKPVNNDK